MEKPAQCPKCKEMTLWHNKGIGKNNKPYENYKCKCGYLEWVPQPKDAPGSNKPAVDSGDIMSLNSRMAELEAIVVGNKEAGVIGLRERLEKIEGMVKSDEVVFYPD